ncbi:potassium channel family protein [Albimonas sp. CAU 1670]|uniref:potassium channel family protein n=1 Tax=Albimonas sp. CAU 1670 TaxID=3032599 RepID=UPI0023DBB895|nr:potassium channel family protein [Albimonas sp. CAU 1670]MDF2234533.1 potassium channel family protein [Albimonas sp. CAU 1670]
MRDRDEDDEDDAPPGPLGRLRTRLYEQLDSEGWRGELMSPLNALVAAMVALACLAAALLTEPSLSDLHPWMERLLALCAAFFTVEFLGRAWVKPESPHWRAMGWRSLRGPAGWHAGLDLLALLGIWIEVATGAGYGLSAMLRLLRLLRVFISGSDTAMARAAREVLRAVRERRMELTVSATVAGLVLMAASIAMYLAEKDVQPEVFGSIPRAMWWSVVTLTTVGYGDATPVTAAGRVIAGLTALFSIALVALPAGIMAAAFSDAMQRARRRRDPDG